MATVQDALKLIEKDPVMGFVGLPILGARPPAPVIIIKMKGHELILPDWTGAEWAWWGDLALTIAAKQDAANPTGQKDKEGALSRFVPLQPAMQTLGAVRPLPPQIATYYDRAVRLVISSNAAASGPTRGKLAAEAFGEAIREAPATIAKALASALQSGAELFLKDLPRSAASILKDLFNATAAGFGLPGLGTLVVIGLGLWYLTQRKSTEV